MDYPDKCPRCGGVLAGGFNVVSATLPDGTFYIGIEGTPDRNFIICDSCNSLLCNSCCKYPQSGYCDECIEKYNLYDYLKEQGIMPKGDVMQGKIVGNYETRIVTIDGHPLPEKKSQAVWNHSPDGFSWSFGGSGPAQLALAILLEFASKEEAVAWHQQFKWEMIAPLPPQDFEMSVADVKAWIERKRKKESEET